MENGRELQTAGMLLDHLERVNFTGLDPSIIKFHPCVAAFRNLVAGKRAGRAWQWASGKSIEALGHRLGWFVSFQPARLPKGLALGALAYLGLFKRTGDARFLSSGLRLIAGLKACALAGGGLWAHGVPYRIRSEEVAATTPNLVTTFFVAQAVWAAARTGSSPEMAAFFHRIIEQAYGCFPLRHTLRGDCFMYTPATSFFVHNANLMLVQMVAQYSRSGGCAVQPQSVFSALDYSLRDFREKRAFPYAGDPTPNSAEDNYHTGFVLRSLLDIRNTEAFASFRPALEETLAFGVRRYWKAFCRDGYVVRDKTRKINAHSLAEGLLMRKAFHAPPEVDAALLDAAIERTRARLWNERAGRFNDSVCWFFGVPFTNKTDYPRWSQAWMAYALARPIGAEEPLG